VTVHSALDPQWQAPESKPGPGVLVRPLWALGQLPGRDP
jgi:hypothetical protein